MSLNVEVVVAAGGATASVAANGSTDLQVRVQGNRPPAADAVTGPGTQIGKLKIVDGLTPGVSAVQVLADLDRLSLAGTLAFAWSLASAPPGSKAALAGASGPQAALAPDLPGTYDLSVTVGYRPPAAANGPTVATPVNVTARPDDPPIGVPVETLSSSSAGIIWIDGQPVPNTKPVTAGLYVAVLNRATRELVRSFTVSNDVSGVSQLAAITNEYKGTFGYLMILSGGGVRDAAAVNLLAGVTNTLGHTLTADERARLSVYPQARFSIIGIPGGAANSAWMYSAYYDFARYPQGDITGYLQVNSATGLYGFVKPEYPAFATAGPGSGGLTNVIQVGARSFSATLSREGATAGLHVLVLDPFTLNRLPEPANNEIWPTNTDKGVAYDQEEQRILVGVLDILTTNNNPGPVVFVQSVGTVKPLVAQLGQALEKLGGNQAVFNSLAQQPGSYALVGRGIYSGAPAGTTVPAGAESSTTLGQSGQLTGVLSRNLDYEFAPLLSSAPDSSLGALNSGLISIAYQAPQSFPSFAGGEEAAEIYIAEQLGLCSSPDEPSCDLRRDYYERYRDNWGQFALDVARLSYPGTAQFTAADFDAVKSQLGDEMSDLNHVKNYLAGLQEPFSKSTTRAYVDLQAIGDEVLADVGRPDGTTTSNAMQMVGAIVGFTKLYFDATGGKPVKLALDGIGATLSLVAALAGNNGAPTLEQTIRAKTSELATVTLDRFETAERSLTAVGLLIASDYGKLTAVAARVKSDWRLPANPALTVNAIRTATQQYYYESLLPVAYPYLLQVSQAPPSGPDNARKVSCWYDGYWKDPFTDQPDSAQGRQVLGFNADGSPAAPVVLIRRGPFTKVGGGPHIQLGHAPAATITDRLFLPATPGSGGIGLNKLQLYSTRYWPRSIPVQVGSHFPFYCGLV